MPGYQASYEIANNLLRYDGSGMTDYWPPGTYALYVTTYGDATTTCDVAGYIQVSPDLGTTWFDYPVESLLLTSATTTNGAYTAGPVRNLFKYTTEPAVSPDGPKIYAVLRWPGGRLRLFFNFTAGGYAAWSSGTTYAANDYVSYDGCDYRSLQGTNLNHTPAYGSSWWHQVAPGCYASLIKYSASLDSRFYYSAPPFSM